MQTLFALGLAAAAAVIVIARPPGPVETTVPQDDSAPHSPTRKYLKDFLLPTYLWPHYIAYKDNHRNVETNLQPPMPPTVWLNQEIERLSRLQQRATNPFKSNLPQRFPHESPFMKRELALNPYNMRGSHAYYDQQPWLQWGMVAEPAEEQNSHAYKEIVKPAHSTVTEPISKEEKKRKFALTPRDDGYFETFEKDTSSVNTISEGVHAGQQGLHEGGGEPATHPELEPEPPRQIRQNPNHSRTKTLVSGDLDKLQVGLGHEKSGQLTSKSQNIHVQEAAAPDSTGSFYDVAVISAIGAAVVMAFLGFAFVWYTLSKRAKAAADVDYPAYGVTGPTMDTSGDRKLAHSAHMYHYQHQKQQIIAMERSGMDDRYGSVSDPESEDENEEGDYTVYECPGFATTGDMEVRNPLFNEEPTPATPGKCEVVKPQPKD